MTAPASFALDPRPFAHSVAVVTGGESGIGAASARMLAARGARVAITYFRDTDSAEAVVADCGGPGRALAVACDVGDERQVEALFAAAEEAFGPVTRLVNSAGVNMRGTALVDMPLAQFDDVIRSDLTGPFLTCRRFARALASSKAGGRIVNISSIHQQAPRVGGADYDAAKGGLAQLGATLALKLAAAGIAVNTVAPGMILTPMNQAAIDNPALRAERETHIPLGRAGTPEDVARLVCFLLSDEAVYITGASVTIDGALSLRVAEGA